MKMSATTVRRGLYGMMAGGLLGGVAPAALIMPSANAAPPMPANPDMCTFSGVANTSSEVSEQTGTYLEAHPAANDALTDIAKQPMEDAQVAYRAYFADNPQVQTE